MPAQPVFRSPFYDQLCDPRHFFRDPWAMGSSALRHFDLLPTAAPAAAAFGINSVLGVRSDLWFPLPLRAPLPIDVHPAKPFCRGPGRQVTVGQPCSPPSSAQFSMWQGLRLPDSMAVMREEAFSKIRAIVLPTVPGSRSM
jgi:hypothetical protein